MASNTALVILCSVLVIIVLALPAVLIWKKMDGGRAKIGILVYVFALILIARVFVLVCWHEPAEESTSALIDLSGLEKFLDSVIHTLQSFSMDEDYTTYTIQGKTILSSWGLGLAADIYGIVISILNICAPILGGAVLLEILTGVFPKIKLAMHPFRRKFVFSTINESSVTLAEDLLRNDNQKKILYWEKLFLKPMIVFTDAYPDQESESKSELFDRARAIRAVCVKNDLEHLNLRSSKSVFYFLMDEDEQSNIAAMAGLLDADERGRSIWPAGEEKTGSADKPGGEEKTEFRTRVFAFCQSDLSVNMFNNLVASSKNAGTLLVRPIRDYSNASVNLIYRVPLFIPLLEDEESERPAAQKAAGKAETGTEKRAEKSTEKRADKSTGPVKTERGADAASGQPALKNPLIPGPDRELHVTLLGSGAIAEEVFKTVYWAGQMAGVQLYIHVLSLEAGRMKKNLKVRCPELFETCDAQSDILRVFPEGDPAVKNPPYAVCDGFDGVIDAECIADYPEEILEKSDYFVVALGDDERNIFVTGLLSKELTRRALSSPGKRRKVIAPAIFNDRVASSVTVSNPGMYEPYVMPFATLSERFSCRNVFMADFTQEALISENLYNVSTHRKRMKDEYSYWSNLARAVHAPYKLFCCGYIKGLDMTKTDEGRFLGEKCTLPARNPEFSWTEHRRWNAYLRTQGFSCPTNEQHEGYYPRTKTHKNLSLKLHPCLVESSMRDCTMPEPADFFGKGFDRSGYDALDFVSVFDYLLTCRYSGETKVPAQSELQEAEYKHWDEPEFDAAAMALAGRLCDLRESSRT